MKKINFLIIIAAFLTSTINAQFTTNWEKRYQFTTASGYSNEAKKVAVDASGNVFELVDITSNIDSLGNPAATTQYYVILQKFNSLGTPIGTPKIINVNNMSLTGNHDYKASFGLEVDASNNVYVGFTKYNGTTYDANVYKYNNTLSTLMRASVYATAGNDFGVDMKIRNTSAMIIVKSVSGTNTTYSVVNMNVPAPPALYSFAVNADVLNALTVGLATNVFVTGYSFVSGVKVALTACVTWSGGLKWSKTYNHGSATGDDYGSEIMISSDGNIYVSGTTYVSTTNGNDVMLLRYSSNNGTLAYGMNINHNGADQGSKLADGPAGYVYVTNDLANQILVYKVLTAAPGTVSASVFYHPVPASQYNTITGVTLADMKVSSSNTVYICGSETGTSNTGNFSASYLVKIGPSGANLVVLNSTSVVGAFSDNYAGVALALDPSTSHVISLRTYWSDNTSHALEKAFLTSLSGGPLKETGSFDNSNSTVNEVSFFPNPASGSINFVSDQTINSVEMCDLTGKTVVVLKPVENKLDISGLKSGLYFAKVSTASGTMVKRIIVQ